MARRTVLQQISVAARAHDFADNVVIGAAGENDDPGAEGLGAHAAHEFDAVQFWQVEIDDSHIGAQLADAGQRGLAIGTLCNHIVMRGAMQDGGKAIPAQGVLIGQKDCDLLRQSH